MRWIYGNQVTEGSRGTRRFRGIEQDWKECTPLLGFNLLAWYIDLTGNKGKLVAGPEISCVKFKVLATTEKTTLTSYIPEEV